MTKAWRLAQTYGLNNNPDLHCYIIPAGLTGTMAYRNTETSFIPCMKNKIVVGFTIYSVSRNKAIDSEYRNYLHYIVRSNIESSRYSEQI